MDEIYLLFGLLIMIGIILWVFKKNPEEKEYDQKLKESLADEFIIDPETGAKLTLEQAESGHWISHDNEFRTIPKEELNKLPTDDEILAETALNYLRESKEYRKTKFTDKQFETLENTKILSSYDDWNYSNPFKFVNGLIFLPAPELHKLTYYCESQIMFWIKIDSINGHYLFREKSSSEKFLDLIRNDDEININNYECFTFEKSHNIILIKNVLKNFENEKKLEIEIHNDNLFIKTTKLVNLEDIKRIEKEIKNVC